MKTRAFTVRRSLSRITAIGIYYTIFWDEREGVAAKLAWKIG